MLSPVRLAFVALLAGCAMRGASLPEPQSAQEARRVFSANLNARLWPAEPSVAAAVPARHGLFADPASASRQAWALADRLAQPPASPARVLEALARELPGDTRPRERVPGRVSGWTPREVDFTGLPASLRGPVGELLSAVASAESDRRFLLDALPAGLTPTRLMDQARMGPGTPADYRGSLALFDAPAFARSARNLLAAVQRLRTALDAPGPLVAVEWRLETPLGLVLVDTTGRDTVHRLRDPLLIIDVGGNDHYQFESRSDANRISIVLDLGGNDTYESLIDGADPSAGLLGFGILWDTAGDDTYRGGAFAQASAVFGVAVLVDEGGVNRFEAQGYSQAHALAGIAILLVGTGNDRYSALTASQGSAGPGGVALLLDRGGDDQYRLVNEPLGRPSPQLPDRNVSMGQGAGYGIRVGLGEAGSASGGLGLLVDLGGNDRYEAQVFAQGVGYQGGVGMLVDAGGADRLEAAWYAMGAAAHGAAGVLLKRGAGNDSYRVSHVMGLGAAHDFSVASFEDEGGDDAYSVADLGAGAAHDNGAALFVDASGVNRYELTGNRCRGFGSVSVSQEGTQRDKLPTTALFVNATSPGLAKGPCASAMPQPGWRLAR